MLHPLLQEILELIETGVAASLLTVGTVIRIESQFRGRGWFTS
tara:strand:- start:225 stop:353 length:129 start_codon:yes stop_codon:yes gene_type:complete